MRASDIIWRGGGLLAERCGRAMGYIKLARVEQVEIAGRAWVRKQRLVAAPLLVQVGRLYARTLTVPVDFLDLDSWQRWERVMHAADALAVRIEPRGVCVPLLAGRPLIEMLRHPACADDLRRRAVRAALRALRALHERTVSIDGQLVHPSHGDASAYNVLYDERTDRARWIDFELRHPLALDVWIRRADDLRTLLFSIASCLAPAHLPRLVRLHAALLALLDRDAHRWLFGVLQSPIDPGRRHHLTQALRAVLAPSGGAQ
jgi:hypothetical protein